MNDIKAKTDRSKEFLAIVNLLIPVLLVTIFFFYNRTNEACKTVCAEIEYHPVVIGNHSTVQITVENTSRKDVIVGVDGCIVSNRTYHIFSNGKKMPLIPNKYGCMENSSHLEVKGSNIEKYSGSIIVGHLPFGYYEALLILPDRSLFSDEAWYNTKDFTEDEVLVKVPIYFWKL